MVATKELQRNYYTPFGMLMPNRHQSSPSYRYGFNGKEKDDEMKGSGNDYDFGARIYDPRVAKFLSVDPFNSKFPSYSPYQYSGNSPIAYIDYNGNFKIVVSDAAQKAGVNAQTIANFLTVVANISKMAQDNPAIIDKMVEQTGQKRETILSWLENNQGPTLYIDADANFGGAESPANALAAQVDGTETLRFASSLILSLNNEKGEQKREAVLFAIAMTIFHEATELGDIKTNGQATSTETGDPGLGKQKTRSMFNHRGVDVEWTIMKMPAPFRGLSVAFGTGYDKTQLFSIKFLLSSKSGLKPADLYRKKYSNFLGSIKVNNSGGLIVTYEKE